MRTLAIILNHNLPELTNKLYYSLAQHLNSSFDLQIMDNGSRKELRSKKTTIQLENNVFWGGALNEAFKIVLENKEYDSLLFLNNDIEVNGEIFMTSLRNELFSNHNFALVSPCISGKANPWKQMQNWGTKTTRIVKWIDNQAPLFHRKLIEEIIQFDEKLIYGWGQELVCAQVCEKNNWHIGVSDFISMIHYGQQTFHQKRLYSLGNQLNKWFSKKRAVHYDEFSEKARSAWINYFKYDEDWYKEMVKYGMSYNQRSIDF